LGKAANFINDSCVSVQHGLLNQTTSPGMQQMGTRKKCLYAWWFLLSGYWEIPPAKHNVAVTWLFA
jgi:hypothetical protein